MRPLASLCLIGLAGALMSCDEPDSRAWVVMDLKFPDRTTAQVAVDSPTIPSWTLNQCRKGLDQALPGLLAIIHQEPNAAGAEIAHARCVISKQDPVLLANMKG